MKIQPILLVIILSLMSGTAFGSDNEKATLNRFLYSKNVAERQQAFNVISSNKDQYRNAVLAELQGYANKPTKTPDALLYLAASIKDERYLQPLSKLINNENYSEEHCIYGCPIVFSLVVFSSFTNYSSPLLNDKCLRRTAVATLLTFWPPGPPERANSISTSLSLIST